MKKTLEMELAEYHKELAHFFYEAIYRNQLVQWHSDGCAFKDDVEMRCDCVLMYAYKLIKHWQRP